MKSYKKILRQLPKTSKNTKIKSITCVHRYAAHIYANKREIEALFSYGLMLSRAKASGARYRVGGL